MNLRSLVILYVHKLIAGLSLLGHVNENNKVAITGLKWDFQVRHPRTSTNTS